MSLEIAVNSSKITCIYFAYKRKSGMFKIKHYIAANGQDVLVSWQKKLKDTKAKLAIDRRINRMELGNFGDHKPCRDGVSELRIDSGPGYRIYYAKAGEYLILLLCGGDKSTQDKDITKACEYWKDWQLNKTLEQE